ncbi:MAG: hypothetical protein Q8P67_10540 [archaeon]|nr:hypothetical protein [archaeon]
MLAQCISSGHGRAGASGIRVPAGRHPIAGASRRTPLVNRGLFSRHSL